MSGNQDVVSGVLTGRRLCQLPAFPSCAGFLSPGRTFPALQGPEPLLQRCPQESWAWGLCKVQWGLWSHSGAGLRGSRSWSAALGTVWPEHGA